MDNDKKLLIGSIGGAFVVVLILFIYILSVMNRLPPIAESNEQKTAGDNTTEQEASQAPTAPKPFDAKSFLPATYVETKIYPLDFENDDISEYALYFKKDDVQRSLESIRTIQYLKIYKWNGAEWEVIKEDEVTEEGGTVNTVFDTIQVIDMTEDGTDEVLVVKRNFSRSLYGNHLAGYYIFGVQANGALEDWAIPRGYLHPEKYLKASERYLGFEEVKLNNGMITENYEVFCEENDDICRDLTLDIPFVNGTFGEPVIREANNF